MTTEGSLSKDQLAGYWPAGGGYDRPNLDVSLITVSVLGGNAIVVAQHDPVIFELQDHDQADSGGR